VARRVVERLGYFSRRGKAGTTMVRSAGGWCVFFNQGCVLQKTGADEGDKDLYKPSVCALFPIQADDDGNWYVRQHGYKKEKWDLFCLDPQNSNVPAAESLRAEIALAQQFENEYQERIQSK
jgi:hypothetical protein